MPKQSYALEPNGPKRLEISWKWMWKNIEVALDGQLLGTIPDRKALRQGQTFQLPDGSPLHVQFVQGLATSGLNVTRNGRPLPGAVGDPGQRLKLAYGVLFFIGGLNLLLGLLAILLESDFLRELGLGWFSIGFGLAFLVLGYLALRGSAAALIVGVVLLSLDAIAGVVLVIAAGGSPAIGGIVMRIFFIIAVAQGIGAAKEMKAAAAGGTSG